MKSCKLITQDIQKEWDEFLNKFTPEYILNSMTMEEYVIGFGQTNKSFCYIVERELDALGGIRGATSAKFGLYYGKTLRDATMKYRSTKKFGDDPNTAFEKIKTELYELITKAKKLKSFRDLESQFSGMFKYKIMYLYNPSIMLPSFNKDDMEYFAERLDLKPEKTFEKLQLQMMKYKKTNYPELSNHEFIANMYEMYGRYISKEEVKLNDERDRILNEELRNYRGTITIYETHQEPKLEACKTKDDLSYYPRDPQMAFQAIIDAENHCENNPEHVCFIRRKDNTPYTEAHHLVPLCFYNEFDVSLDVPENIVSLCSNCHNEIHYGKNADELISHLYHLRKEKLKEAGIEIELEELLKKYHCINSKE